MASEVPLMYGTVAIVTVVGLVVRRVWSVVSVVITGDKVLVVVFLVKDVVYVFGFAR